MLVMRGRDADGNWGAPTAQFFMVEVSGPDLSYRTYLPVLYEE
jgi:hypothetical protein